MKTIFVSVKDSEELERKLNEILPKLRYITHVSFEGNTA
jgi:hypothetical protein